jgi:hypothetical protein
MDAAMVNIAPQELGHALAQFAEQTTLHVLYAADLVRGLSTRGVTGAVTPHEALRQLLSGTGLVYPFVDTSTIAVHHPIDTPTPAEHRGTLGFQVMPKKDTEK